MSDVTYTVDSEDDGIRLDRWFKRHRPDVSFALLAKWLRTGQVRLDGKRSETGARLSQGQLIRVPPGELAPPPKAASWTKQRAPLSDSETQDALAMVIHRDAAALVLNKPPGLATQGGTNTDTHVDRLLDALLFGEASRPKLVHRLDKDTSGVLLLGRTPKSTEFFAESFRSREAHKIYWALVVGVPKQREGVIDAPLAKAMGAGNLEKMTIDPNGLPARTRYRVVDSAANRAAWLELEPMTGRTHQLRVHCAEALGCPIVGDGKYGGPKETPSYPYLTGGISRKLHLHARRLIVPHPSGELLDITAPAPRHMLDSFSLLGFEDSESDGDFDPLSAGDAFGVADPAAKAPRAKADKRPKLHHTELWKKVHKFKPKSRRGKGRSK
jgi:23S rRNA pseudouridine955/2504/2580 synthase